MNASARYRVLVLLTAAFLFTGRLNAYVPGTGAIVGSVHDPSDLAVVNAAVAAVNESTGVTISAATNSAADLAAKAMRLVSDSPNYRSMRVQSRRINYKLLIKIYDSAWSLTSATGA